MLRPVYKSSGGLDGRVSIEVDPGFAYDAERTESEAKLLWSMVDRPNAMIKIPATRAGLRAVTAMISSVRRGGQAEESTTSISVRVGGVHGAERGFCLMIGGESAVVERLGPVFRALAPGVDAAARTAGRDGEPASEEHGYLHCGPAGPGHFVKMVHNGIEYGQMAARRRAWQTCGALRSQTETEMPGAGSDPFIP